MNAQMKKGILEMCLLFKLSGQDYYGYTLMREMKQSFPEVNDSTFYAILRRMHKEGDTDIYYGNDSKGPKRKYYRITDKGRKTLDTAVGDWQQIKNIVQDIGIS